MICFEGLRKISKLSSQFYETARSRKHLYNAEKVLQPVMSRGPWDIIEYLKYCKYNNLRKCCKVKKEKEIRCDSIYFSHYIYIYSKYKRQV